MRISYREFLRLCDEDTLAEWVDGSIEFYSPASLLHQDIALWLAKIIDEYSNLKDVGKVIIAPFQMYLKDIKRAREPDIIFIKKENLKRLNTTYLKGGGDLVIEITSPTTEEKDKKIKLEEYKQAKIKEYWIIDPYNKKAYFYQLKEDRYKQIKPVKGIYHSREIEGFWIDINWIFKKRLPSIHTVLVKILKDEYKKFLEKFIK